MPKALERKLMREARAKGLTGKRFNAYVYGTMRHTTNWVPSREKKGRHSIAAARAIRRRKRKAKK